MGTEVLEKIFHGEELIRPAEAVLGRRGPMILCALTCTRSRIGWNWLKKVNGTPESWPSAAKSPYEHWNDSSERNLARLQRPGWPNNANFWPRNVYGRALGRKKRRLMQVISTRHNFPASSKPTGDVLPPNMHDKSRRGNSVVNCSVMARFFETILLLGSQACCLLLSIKGRTNAMQIARLLLLSCVVMLAVTVLGQTNIPPFIAEGTISTKAFRYPATNYFGRLDGKVMFSYSNGIWQVQFSPQLSYPMTIKKESESVEDWKSISDGTRQIVTFINDTNTVAGNGVPIRPSAEATTNLFPTVSKKGLFLPWLSLCPNPDLPFIDSNSIPFNFQPKYAGHPNNKGTYRASYLEPQNVFLAQLEITNNGTAFDMNGASFIYPEPFNKGFLELSYHVIETTNYQGITLPMHAVLYGFDAKPDGKAPGDIYAGSISEFYIQKYDFTGSNLALFPVPHRLVAMDYRLTTNDVHANYEIINDQWASVTNGKVKKWSLKAEQMSQQYARKPDNSGKRRLVMIALGILALAAPAILLVSRYINNKQK